MYIRHLPLPLLSVWRLHTMRFRPAAVPVEVQHPVLPRQLPVQRRPGFLRFHSRHPRQRIECCKGAVILFSWFCLSGFFARIPREVEFFARISREHMIKPPIQTVHHQQYLPGHTGSSQPCRCSHNPYSGIPDPCGTQLIHQIGAPACSIGFAFPFCIADIAFAISSCFAILSSMLFKASAAPGFPFACCTCQ